MKKFITLNTLFLLTAICCFGQMEKYDSIAKIANRHYDNLDYKLAVIEFENAFNIFGGKGLPWDRYKAAKAYTQLKNNDSAFFNLFRLAEKTDFLSCENLKGEKEFVFLHNDERWNKLLNILNPNKEVFNDSLAAVLEKIHEIDQKYRLQTDITRKEFGYESKEYQGLCDKINYHDSINLIKIIDILDKYGWLSINEVGKIGSQTLWLVIQHADLETQVKYFPIMEKAVANGKALAKDLAFLQDRILMRQGKNQLYGTQYIIDYKTNTSKLWEIEDPENLNARRQSVGLYPMAIPK